MWVWKAELEQLELARRILEAVVFRGVRSEQDEALDAEYALRSFVGKLEVRE